MAKRPEDDSPQRYVISDGDIEIHVTTRGDGRTSVGGWLPQDPVAEKYAWRAMEEAMGRIRLKEALARRNQGRPRERWGKLVTAMLLVMEEAGHALSNKELVEAIGKKYAGAENLRKPDNAFVFEADTEAGPLYLFNNETNSAVKEKTLKNRATQARKIFLA